MEGEPGHVVVDGNAGSLRQQRQGASLVCNSMGNHFDVYSSMVVMMMMMIMITIITIIMIMSVDKRRTSVHLGNWHCLETSDKGRKSPGS